MSLGQLKQRYQTFVDKKLNLDMTRGKPCAAQLDLSDPLLTNLVHQDVLIHNDCRNYSPPPLLSGLPEMKTLMAEVLGIDAKNIVIGGNSSLNLMYDTLIKAMLFPLPGQDRVWSSHDKVKFLCPVPGYDRHFSICESLGIEMINVPLTGHGPDMDRVEQLVAEDAAIKGMWCVPKYSNPTGEIYSNEVIRRLATMKTAAADFTLFWDNAYAVHHLDMSKPFEIMDILAACESAGHANRVFMYASTSKITYAGAGVAILAANEANLAWYLKHMKIQTIGYDKINQLRHLKLLKDKAHFMAHMGEHAKILKPKFDIVDSVLRDELGQNGEYATWRLPDGGYFISFNTKAGLARKVIDMAAKAGVKLTEAGATYPYGRDSNDSNIRIAPSLPSVEELKLATEILAVVVKIATKEAL
ncbi:MAG: aminotransferase class I/II-fold pyridoxal phosphate-dependent enzyme [Francisellaceae bacterium]